MWPEPGERQWIGENEAALELFGRQNLPDWLRAGEEGTRTAAMFVAWVMSSAEMENRELLVSGTTTSSILIW